MKNNWAQMSPEMHDIVSCMSINTLQHDVPCLASTIPHKERFSPIFTSKPTHLLTDEVH